MYKLDIKTAKHIISLITEVKNIPNDGIEGSIKQTNAIKKTQDAADKLNDFFKFLKGNE